jgi:hypothetical protein
VLADDCFGQLAHRIEAGAIGDQALLFRAARCAAVLPAVYPLRRHAEGLGELVLAAKGFSCKFDQFGGVHSLPCWINIARYWFGAFQAPNRKRGMAMMLRAALLTHRAYHAVCADQAKRGSIDVTVQCRKRGVVLCGRVCAISHTDDGAEVFQVRTRTGTVWLRPENVRACSGVDGRCQCSGDDGAVA